MRTVVVYMMIVVLLSSLIACGGEPAAEVAETEAPTEEAVPATEAPTATPEPTDTPEPEPTDTPEPTPTEEPTVEATVAAEFELEPLEHPSGAFSSLVPVDAFLTDVDSDDLEFPSVRATYLDRLIIQEGDIAFGVSASIQPKADDAILADIYEEVLDNMSSADTESIEIVSQEQLDEDRLLFDLKGIDETLTDGKLLLVDGGPSVFALLFLTSDVEATAGTWAAISEGYTYDPALTADLLANPDAFAEEAADIELERMEHPSGAFSVMIPVEAMETGIDSREAKRPSINSFYMDMENLDMNAAPLTLGVAADIRAKSDEVTLEDLSSDFLDEMSLELEVDPETISQEQEWLDDERLLTDLVISDPTGGEQKMYLKTLLVDGGASVFNLTILTTNLEATESAQTEILDSYTYDPDLAAELLAGEETGDATDEATVTEEETAAAPAEAETPADEAAAFDPAGTVLFADTFDDNAAGWPEGSAEGVGAAAVQDGHYALTMVGKEDALFGGAYIEQVLPGHTFSDFLLTVEATPPDAAGHYSYGVAFRENPDTAHSYVFEIGNDQMYSLQTYDGEWGFAINWTDSDAIVVNGTNEITIQAVGDALTFFINGTQVASITDSTFSEGSVGFVVEQWLSGEGEVTVRFDNLTITSP